MPKLTTIDDANAALLPYVPLVAQLTGQENALETRDRPFMTALGNPQNKLKVVHIAGTSGKTSTAYFTAALLQAAGQKVGLTVSPHVDSVTERVQIDGRPLSDDKFCEYLGEFLELVERQPLKPSYFALLYAFSFWVFEKAGVDYAVVETGLGGLLDATNLADRADKVCVITDIGYDHMHILGHTLPEIAAQKIGIVHPHNPVIMYRQSPEVMAVVEDWIRQKQARLMVTTEADERALSDRVLDAGMPVYQQRNWLLAYAVYRFVQERDKLPQLTAEQLTIIQRLQVPGRMDVRQVGDKTIVMDGAHNGQKMHTFLESFQARYPEGRPAVMIALKQGKEPADVVPQLAAIAASVIVTTFDTSQDLPAKSIDPEELARLFRQHGVMDLETIADHHQAYERLLEKTSKVGIITGSFYLLSQVRAAEQLQV